MDLPFAISPCKVYSVSELTSVIKIHLEEAFQNIWVEGEVSNFRRHPSGHLYFTLKDTSSQIRAVMFRSQARLVAFEPQDGMHLLCRGRVGVYEVRGEYQIIVDFLEPRGLGALQRAFEQLKARLLQEGLFDPARKKPLPLLPRRIGIVTSPTGAAVRDMLQILDRRFPKLHILIRPVRVQGEGALQEVVEAIQDLNRFPEVNLIVLARGGGSLEDLWTFNEEALARAIAGSSIPVVSAVGHEVDITIADFVADVRAPTPSAAAELIVPLYEDLQETLGRLRQDLLRTVSLRLQRSLETAQELAQRLQDPRRKVADRRILLDDMQARLSTLIRQLSTRTRDALHAHTERLMTAGPGGIIRTARASTAEESARLRRAAENHIQQKRNALEQQAALLDSLSPLNVLSRGYSITYRIPTEEIVRDARVLASGERLLIRFQLGEATCRVEGIGNGTDRTKR